MERESKRKANAKVKEQMSRRGSSLNQQFIDQPYDTNDYIFVVWTYRVTVDVIGLAAMQIMVSELGYPRFNKIFTKNVYFSNSLTGTHDKKLEIARETIRSDALEIMTKREGSNSLTYQDRIKIEKVFSSVFVKTMRELETEGDPFLPTWTSFSLISDKISQFARPSVQDIIPDDMAWLRKKSGFSSKFDTDRLVRISKAVTRWLFWKSYDKRFGKWLHKMAEIAFDVALTAIEEHKNIFGARMMKSGKERYLAYVRKMIGSYILADTTNDEHLLFGQKTESLIADKSGIHHRFINIASNSPSNYSYSPERSYELFNSTDFFSNIDTNSSKTRAWMKYTICLSWSNCPPPLPRRTLRKKQIGLILELIS
jgi:hypothetical protein